jgi:hypothetical protein
LRQILGGADVEVRFVVYRQSVYPQSGMKSGFDGVACR